VRTRAGRVRWSEHARLANELLYPFGLDLDVTLPLSKASPVERTLVAIVAALQGWDDKDGVLVLDEPTAVLPPDEVNRLFRIIRQVRARGSGVLYVSHRLDEVVGLCDRVTVLRGGKKVCTRPVAGLSKRELVHMMLGVEMEPDYQAPIPEKVDEQTVLEVKGLAGTYLRGAAFSLHRGEVLGIAGLPDSGRDELPRLLTDRRMHARAGMVRCGTGDWTAVNRWDAGGVVLLPPDRGREGMIAAMSLKENLSLSVLETLGSFGRLNKRREEAFAQGWVEKMGIVAAGLESPVQTLSGGNQQKVLFGRTLARDPMVMVLCEPTAGVDIGARHAIFELVAQQAHHGLSVVVTSSDAGDLLALCTRVLVLRDGLVSSELQGRSLTERRLVQAMEGLETEGS
jgi:ABC-type sugar transport system ATPase subunit